MGVNELDHFLNAIDLQAFEERHFRKSEIFLAWRRGTATRYCSIELVI
jgi:hypothetical protein